MNCSEMMTKDPSCCVPTNTAYDAAQLMKSEDVGAIPAVNDQETKKLVGIVTDRDLTLKVVAEGRDPKSVRVQEVMSTDLATVNPDDDVEKALNLMEDHQVRRMPVVNGNGRLVGIISQADIATRLDQPEKTAEMVEEVSKAAA